MTAARIYDYRCKGCGAQRAIKANADPGLKPCRACNTQGLRWWRSRSSAPPIVPNTVAMGLGTSPIFGPTPDELADEGRPFTRRIDSVEDMQLGFRKDVPSPRGHVQESMVFGDFEKREPR